MTYLILPSYVCDEENYQIFSQMISSLQSNTQNYKLIGIDNGSILEALELLREFSDIFVQFDTPIGYAKAVNIGWKITEELPDCEYVGVLNNDLTFSSGWLDSLISNLDENTAACASYDQEVGDIVTDHIWSSCFLMRHKIRKAIGYFDSEFLPFRYHDQDSWMRAKSMGLQFKRVGKSRVTHKESTTYKKMPERNNEERERQIVEARWGTHMAQYYHA